MVTRLLWRRMSVAEFNIYLSGGEVLPLPTCRTAIDKNSFDKPLMCFFGTANNAMWWGLDVNSLEDVIACFEVDEKEICSGHGVYPDWSIDMFEWLILFSQNKDKNVLVKEYGLNSYSQKNAKIVEWGTVVRDGAQCILKLNNGKFIERGPAYNDLYTGKADLKRVC